jgi:hypothetical protein
MKIKACNLDGAAKKNFFFLGDVGIFPETLLPVFQWETG